MLPTEPKRSRLHTQPEYGVPADAAGMLSWNHVLTQLHHARHYWLVTVRPDGKPHAVPVWGVWVDGTLHFGMGRQTRKARNIAANPHVVMHLDSSEEVVIIEGRAAEISDPILQARIDDAYDAKYHIRHGTPVYALHPSLVLAWNRDFPRTATRWTFGND